MNILYSKFFETVHIYLLMFYVNKIIKGMYCSEQEIYISM